MEASRSEGVAAELARQTEAYDTNLTVTGAYEMTRLRLPD